MSSLLFQSAKKIRNKFFVFPEELDWVKLYLKFSMSGTLFRLDRGLNRADHMPS